MGGREGGAGALWRMGSSCSCAGKGQGLLRARGTHLADSHIAQRLLAIGSVELLELLLLLGHQLPQAVLELRAGCVGLGAGREDKF